MGSAATVKWNGYTSYLIDGVKEVGSVIPRASYGSKEMARFLPLFVTYLKLKFGIALKVIKVAERDGNGGGTSARTHFGGWGIDLRSWNLNAKQREVVIREAARFGLILHYRTKAQGFDPHMHGMLWVSYSTPCSYQIDATREGRNGLAKRGKDAEADVRPVSSWRSFEASTAELASEVRALQGPKKNELERLLDTMTVDELAAKLAPKIWDHIAIPKHKQAWGQTMRNLIPLTAHRSEALLGEVSKLRDELQELRGLVVGLRGELVK